MICNMGFSADNLDLKRESMKSCCFTISHNMSFVYMSYEQ